MSAGVFPLTPLPSALPQFELIYLLLNVRLGGGHPGSLKVFPVWGKISGVVRCRGMSMEWADG